MRLLLLVLFSSEKDDNDIEECSCSKAAISSDVRDLDEGPVLFLSNDPSISIFDFKVILLEEDGGTSKETDMLI